MPGLVFFLFLKLSVTETKCEDLCEAKVCELVSPSYKDFMESMELCTML